MLAESRESRELFSSYVINRFSIEASFREGNSEVLGLSYVGEEVDGQFLWVYQEIPAQDDIMAFTIVNLTLRDVWSDQSNLVNIERWENLQSHIRRFGRSAYSEVGRLIRSSFVIGLGLVSTDHSEKIISLLAGTTVIVFKYLSRQILQTAAVVTSVLLFVVLTGRFVQYLAEAIAGEKAPDILLLLMLFRIPEFLLVIVPLAFFLAHSGPWTHVWR